MISDEFWRIHLFPQDIRPTFQVKNSCLFWFFFGPKIPQKRKNKHPNLGGGNSNYFFNVHLENWGLNWGRRFPIWLAHIFQIRWENNHQLEIISPFTPSNLGCLSPLPGWCQVSWCPLETIGSGTETRRIAAPISLFWGRNVEMFFRLTVRKIRNLG